MTTVETVYVSWTTSYYENGQKYHSGDGLRFHTDGRLEKSVSGSMTAGIICYRLTVTDAISTLTSIRRLYLTGKGRTSIFTERRDENRNYIADRTWYHGKSSSSIREEKDDQKNPPTMNLNHPFVRMVYDYLTTGDESTLLVISDYLRDETREQ
jgi:hypothetical protein